MEESRMNDTDIFREMMGFAGNELAGLGVDHRALEVLRDNLMGDMDFLDGENQRIQDHNDPQYINNQKRMKEIAEIQRRLFEADQLGISNQIEESKMQPQDEQTIGINQLCSLRTRGFNERVLRLTEIFLPAEDDPIRIAMDNYNKSKLPRLRNQLDPKATEQRKRLLKNQVKTLNDQLKNRSRGHQLHQQQQSTNLQFLSKEKLFQDQIQFLNERRYDGLSNIQKSFHKNANKTQKCLLGSRKAPHMKKIEDKKIELHKPIQSEENKDDASTQLQINQKNEERKQAEVKQQIMSKVQKNLQEIEIVLKNQENESEELQKCELAKQVYCLNKKLQGVSAEKDFDIEKNSFLQKYLNKEELLVFQQSFDTQYFNHMQKLYTPIPNFILSKTEKECFLFCSQNDFEQQNLQKGYAQFFPDQRQINNKAAFIGSSFEFSNDNDLRSEQENNFKKSMFGCFFKQQDQDMNMIESNDQIVQISKKSSQDSSQNNNPYNKLIQLNSAYKFKCQVTLPMDYYEDLQKDGKIRDAMAQCKFRKLSQANPSAGPLKRRKYWGELKEEVSQQQIDKDFSLYRYFQSRLPNDVTSKEPVFILKSLGNQSAKFIGKQPDFDDVADIDNQIQFQTKYGSLNLINANPNNFKIHNVDEYEFVQRQRAFIYDPLHLKGSSQLKSFTSQVGFGSKNELKVSGKQGITLPKTFDKDQTIQNLCQNIQPSFQEQRSIQKSQDATSEILEVCQLLGIKQQELELNLQLDPKSLLGFAFAKDPEQLRINDFRKQKPLKQNIDYNNTDNFDTLTDNVKVKKLEELIQIKQEENRKNAQIDKKNQSTAYKILNLSMPKPRILPHNNDSQDQIQDSNIKGDHYGKQNNIFKNREAKQDHSENEMDENNDDYQNRSLEGSQKTDASNLQNKQHSQKSEFDYQIIQEDDISQSTDEDQLFYEDVPDANLNQQANHAKCILDLSFTKFEWSLNEDYTKCHRPDIDSLFQQEREKININESITNQNNPLSNSNTQISIGVFGDVKILNQFNQKQQTADSQSQQRFVELPLRIIDRETVKSKNKKRGIINADEYFKDRVKLSLKDGKFCIFEHIDQHPIYINNFGMVSQLHRYIFNDNKKIPRQDFLPSSTNYKAKHMGPYGQQFHKQVNSKSLLLGKIDKSKFQGISILSNKLYKAPVFFHKTQQTDFFCSFHQDRKGHKQIILREIQSVYTVGQIEPQLSVYDPQSRSYQNYIKQRCQAYILRFLQENNNWIDFQNIQNIFPYLTDQKLKKFIKEISVEVNRDQICSSSKQINDETIKNLITPEMICQYESARYGEAMLAKRGIESITKAGKISYASNRYCQDQRDVLRQKISKFIENEVLCTPWNLSQNFCTIHSSHSGAHSGMLMIKGVGDPSNGNGGYSFLKMPLKISNDSLQDCMKIRVDLNPAIQNPKSVTGTDADLRKLKKEVIFKKLVEMGYDVREILSMTRWNMVGLLREQSSCNQKNSQLDEKNKRYARGIRYTSKTQREVYHKRVDELFKIQMVQLTGQNDFDDFSDYEDPTLSLNVPALQNRNNQQGKNIAQIDDNDSGDGEILGFNQLEGIKKFTVEISEKQKINELMIEKPRLNEFGEEISSQFISNPWVSGSIQKLFDIPNYKKLLLARIEAPNQNLQTGQQIGLLRSGTNQINQIDGNAQSKTAEQILEEGLNNKSLDLSIEILKKVVRNEDSLQDIERIEFISADKIINQFKKRQKKCKSRRAKKRITNLKQLNRGTNDQQMSIDQDYQRSQAQNLPSGAIKLDVSNVNQINLGQQNSQSIKLSGSSLNLGQTLDSKGNIIKKNLTFQSKQIEQQNDNSEGLFTIPLSGLVGQQNKPGAANSKSTKVIGLGQIGKGENIDQVLQNHLKMNQQLSLSKDNKIKNAGDGEFKMPKSLTNVKDTSRSNSRYKGQKSVSSSSTTKKTKNKQNDISLNFQKLDGLQNSQIIGQQNQFDIQMLASNPIFQNLLSMNAQGLVTDQLNLDGNEALNSLITINPDFLMQQEAQIQGTEISINLGPQPDYNAQNSLNSKKRKSEQNQFDLNYNPGEMYEQKSQKQKQQGQKQKQNNQQDKKIAESKKQKHSSLNDKSQSKQIFSNNEQLLASIKKEQESLLSANKKVQTSRRAKQSGESILNGIIEQIVEECIREDPKLIFRYPVEKKVAPGYYNIIQKPICLENMKQKAKRQEYKSIEQFKEDMSLMRRNCEQFNGLHNEFTETAVRLEQHALSLIKSKEYSESIQTASLKIDYLD